MDEPFICCYSDVLFTPDVVGRLAASPDDMALGVDTAWLERYEHRTEHPPDDAEKVTVAERPRHARSPQDSRARRARRVHRRGEVLGRRRRAAARALPSPPRASSPAGRGARPRVFEKAYKILLFQDMIEQGERFAHVDTPGGYIEVDTQQDFEYARQHWITKHLERR